MQTPDQADPKKDQAHKTITIIVNAIPKAVTTKEISYEQVISLDYNGNPPQGDGWEFTVTYRRGEGHKSDGSLVAGESVKVKEGMIFDVHATDRS